MRRQLTRCAMSLLVRGIRPLLGLACLLALGGAAQAACPPPDAGRLDYKVLVEGKPAGRLEMDFQGDGVRTQVRTTIAVQVNILFLIPVLIYRHDSRETWVAGAFRHFSGLTVDNGREYNITVDAKDGALRVVRNGVATEVTATLLTGAVWCQQTLRNERILNPLKGRLKRVSAEYLGQERVKVGAGSTLARHYAVTQQGRRGAVWYGEDGIVVKARFPTKSGRQVTILLHRASGLDERAGEAASLPRGPATPYRGWSMRHWAGP